MSHNLKYSQLNLMICIVFCFTCVVSCDNSSPDSTESTSLLSNESEEHVDPIIETEPIVAVAEEEALDEGVSVFCETNFDVYLYDPGEAFTNVRSSPGGDVVMSLPWGDNDSEYMVTVIGVQDGWFKLQNPILGMVDDFEIPDGVGWVHHSVVTADSRNYGNEPINVYEEATEQSKVNGVIKIESGGLRPVDACGDWVYIKYKFDNGELLEGWVEAEWLCGNPLTNCS